MASALTWLVFFGFFLSLIFLKGLIIICRYKKLGVPLRWEKDYDERNARFVKYQKENWKTDLEEWKERNPLKKFLLVTPIISHLVEIADLFSSDPFPLVYIFEEE